MKILFFSALSFFLLGPKTGFAQCGKSVVLQASKTEYLDANFALQGSANDSSVISIDQNILTVRLKKGDDNSLTGTASFEKCNWRVPYKNGLMIIKAALSDQRGDTKNCMLTIEAKGGKTIVLIEVEGFADKKMRLLVDSFKEKPIAGKR